MDIPKKSDGKLLAEEFVYHAGLLAIKGMSEAELRTNTLMLYTQLHTARKTINHLVGQLLLNGLSFDVKQNELNGE